jgi:hypothetical protein
MKGVPVGKSITQKTYAMLEESLNELVRAVPQEFTEAVTAEWQARAKKNVADVMLESAMVVPNRKLRKFLQRYHDLGPGETIDVRAQQWYVNYDRKANGGREVVRPCLSFDLHVFPGVKICVDCHPHDNCKPDMKVMVLLRAMRKVRAMVEGARGV